MELKANGWARLSTARFGPRIRRPILVIVIYLSLSLIVLICLVLGLFEGYETFFVHILDNIILSRVVNGLHHHNLSFRAASVVSISWIFCSPIWKKTFIRSLPIIGRFQKQEEPQNRFTPNPSEVPETEIYFIQLRTAWI
uniref:G_PROTEIN_RECEP_F1_2 domain-containing protein n=1 Tax=Caenorhabditis tropicalis TaxID=1561998 RepID=A0A1I7TDK6_9PELO